MDIKEPVKDKFKNNEYFRHGGYVGPRFPWVSMPVGCIMKTAIAVKAEQTKTKEQMCVARDFPPTYFEDFQYMFPWGKEFIEEYTGKPLTKAMVRSRLYQQYHDHSGKKGSGKPCYSSEHYENDPRLRIYKHLVEEHLIKKGVFTKEDCLIIYNKVIG